MDPDSIMFGVIIIVLAAVFSAIFKAFSEAFSRLDDTVIDEMADVDQKKAKALEKIDAFKTKYSQKARTIATIFDAVIAAVCFLNFTTAFYLAFVPVVFPDAKVAVAMGYLAIVCAAAILLFIWLCVIRPIAMILGRKNPERFCASGLWFYRLVSAILFPFTFLFDLPAKLFTRLFGVEFNEIDSSATEKEIRQMVDEGVIEDVQKEMINNVFEFDDRTVDEVMTHRRDIVGIDLEEATLENITSIAIETGYSRLPLYKNDIDNIIGVIYVKDLLKFTSCSGDFDAEGTMRSPLYVPESIHCRDLFKQFKDKKMQMAVVVDEYGGTSGIVTMEDIVESIVGNIQDEYDDEEEEISQISENVYRFDGSVSIDEVSKLLDVEIEEDEYDTLGGFLTHLLGRIPEEDEKPEIVYKNATFNVILVEDKRIATVDAKVEPIIEDEE